MKPKTIRVRKKAGKETQEVKIQKLVEACPCRECLVKITCRGFEFLFNTISWNERDGCKRITQWFKKAFPGERTEEFCGYHNLRVKGKFGRKLLQKLIEGKIIKRMELL